MKLKSLISKLVRKYKKYGEDTEVFFSHIANENLTDEIAIDECMIDGGQVILDIFVMDDGEYDLCAYADDGRARRPQMSFKCY